MFDHPDHCHKVVEDIIQALQNKPCWYVSCGGRIGSTFQLALGGKIRRVQPHQHIADEYDEFEGTANLLVWCAWRLDRPDAPLSSWDDSEENYTTALRSLANRAILDVSASLPGWDLILTFSGDIRLHIFCDHVSEASSASTNWELFMTDKIIACDFGSRIKVEARATRPNG